MVKIINIDIEATTDHMVKIINIDIEATTDHMVNIINIDIDATTVVASISMLIIGPCNIL